MASNKPNLQKRENFLRGCKREKGCDGKPSFSSSLQLLSRAESRPPSSSLAAPSLFGQAAPQLNPIDLWKKGKRRLTVWMNKHQRVFSESPFLIVLSSPIRYLTSSFLFYHFSFLRQDSALCRPPSTWLCVCPQYPSLWKIDD